MLKIKGIAGVFIAALALSAMIAASASADQWNVNGAPLVGSASLALKANADSLLLLETGSGSTTTIRVDCTGSISIEGGTITAPNLNAATSLTFNSCTSQAPEKCKIQTEITTEGEGVKSEAELNSAGKVRILFKPKTGKTFAEIDYTGEGCSLDGEKPVNGAVTAAAPTGTEEKTLQILEGLGTTENNTSTQSLELAKNPVYLLGKVLLELASKSKWSF